MKIVHISDSHSPKYHSKLIIPECDVLIHSGDIGGRTTNLELFEFLSWFDAQPAKKKIWIAGNHDICLDIKWANFPIDPIINDVRIQVYKEAKAMLDKYPGITYLENTDYVYEGIKFYGSPITPSFHRQNWAFNADRGEEIKKYWARIPSDVNVLITHGPPYGIMDTIPLKYKQTPDEDIHRGCQDLLNVIKKRLINLELHCFGHLHNHYGVIKHPVSNSREILFSNGSILNEDYTQIVIKPLIINL
jgi:Icc-related predicted phosphoesterase